MARTAARHVVNEWWELPDEELLDVRICDLGLALEGSPVESCASQLQEELVRRGFRFRPYVWFSTDWFTPDGATGFAIPFYLGHPRLTALERKQMLEVEGSGRSGWMRLMRHEAAHAIDNAYRLRRRKRWREVFGRPSEPYSSTYAPDPTSRDHVLNLDCWYSQSHPLEDYAETFAVWLRMGRSKWRARYAGWGALDKLEYIEELMKDVAPRAPCLRTRAKEEPLSSVRYTLREYYRRKRAVYALEGTPAFDGQLRRVFSAGEEGARASSFLRRQRRHLVRRVSDTTGQHRYLLDHVLREMTSHCRTHDLRLGASEAEAVIDAAILLTSLSSQYLYGAHPRYQR